jgi:hypothetical protein
MLPLGPNEKEDAITVGLCRALQRNRTARGLMFQIRTQVVELEPAAGEDIGRMDIVFLPLIPREDIYFCLENKRLNVIKNGQRRTYASEYVSFGMLRFVSGQYAKSVAHGGMLAYVFDGDIPAAIESVETNIKAQHVTLGMTPPGEFTSSTIMVADSRVRETIHRRAANADIRLHHIFMPSRPPQTMTQ